MPVAAGSSTCEVVFTANGIWAPPAGVSKVEALLVGASGAATDSYGGGGGDVRIVELSPSGVVTVVVGVGGVGNVAGGASSVTQGALVESAAGGEGAAQFNGGNSGNGNSGLSGGGGAGGGPAPSSDGGPGIVLSSLPSTLFATDTDCFGGGGAGWAFEADTAATCGGGYSTGFVQNTPNGPNAWIANTGGISQFYPIANSGGGASPVVGFNTSTARYTLSAADGVDGQVTLRFTLVALAATGSSESVSGVLLAGLLVLVGGGAIVASRRGRTRLN